MKNAWLVRPFPHEIKRLDEFKAKNIIAVGWPGIGDLTGETRENIKTILSSKPYSLSGIALGNAYATIDIFVNRMQTGDLVLIPDGEDIYFAKITGSYYLEKSVDNNTDGYPHQRKIKWLSNVSRKDLSTALRSSLKVHRATADLGKHYDEINALSHGEVFQEETSATEALAVTYPLRSDFSVSFNIPIDINRTEAKRLSAYLESLYFTE
jgi:predicted Mrr-cat superfamily restriction endonuclease